jgi:serine/threonine protein kinase
VAVKEFEKRDLELQGGKLEGLLQKEMQAIRSLNHENIIKCYDLIESGNRKYQVLEFIDGRDLRRDLNLD